MAPVKPPKFKKRSFSQSREDDDDDVSNKEILNAISGLTKRMTDFEDRIVLMVNEKVASVEKKCMDHMVAHQKRTDDCVGGIEKRMEDFVQQVSADIVSVIDDKLTDAKIHQVVSTSIANVTNFVSENRIDELERAVRMNELVISGVPYVADERIIDIVSNICKAIKFTGGIDSIETCFRLPTASNRRRTSSSIIVKFWGADAKNQFFKQYFVAKKLCTTMIGFTAKSRIYVNENLTKRNFEIFCKCRDLKRDGKIARFNTQRGRVVVRINGTGDANIINSLEQLRALITRPAAAEMESN